MPDSTIIEVSADNMTARLIIPPNVEPSIDEIAQLISEHAICFGIIDESIKQACSLCNTERQLVLAQGQFPHAIED